MGDPPPPIWSWVMGLVDHIDAFTTTVGALDADARTKVLIVLDSQRDVLRRRAHELLGDRAIGNVADLVIRIATDPSMGPVATAQLRDIVVQASPEMAARERRRSPVTQR